MTLILALIIDAIFGEPKQIWNRITHPAILMGRLIDRADRSYNRGENKRLKGTVLITALCIGTYLIGKIIAWIPDFGLLEILITAILLAHRSLVDHVKDVAQALAISTEDGRTSVARIVGRDTSTLDQSGISRAAIESAAENFSDGVIAPAFWFLILGLPGILIYKIVNTADSMIGYLTPKHAEFGWASARLDDLMNWIPARLTGALFCLISKKRETWAIMRDDAQYHRSPNAGWPEAAMAGTLDIALSGPRSYEGQLTQDPFVHTAGRRNLTTKDINRSISVLWKAWGLFLALTLILATLTTIV